LKKIRNLKIDCKAYPEQGRRGVKNAKNNSRRDPDVEAYHDTPWGGVAVWDVGPKGRTATGPAVFGGYKIVDKLRQPADIAADSDLIGGAVSGDGPTGICRRLKRVT
jgi:hypothetical protein